VNLIIRSTIIAPDRSVCYGVASAYDRTGVPGEAGDRGWVLWEFGADMKGLNNLTLRRMETLEEFEKKLPDDGALNGRRGNSDASETKHSGDLRGNSTPRRSDCLVQLNHAHD
jgi:hypothetical protein